MKTSDDSTNTSSISPVAGQEPMATPDSPGRLAAASNSILSRSPSLLVTILGGMVAAILCSQFEVTLREMVSLAFFMTVLLGFPEAVCAQSALANQSASRSRNDSIGTVYWQELQSAAGLALGAGLMVATMAFVWRGSGLEAVVIGASLTIAATAGGLYGVVVPRLLRFLGVSDAGAGPLALVATDLTTLTILLSAASMAQ